MKFETSIRFTKKFKFKKNPIGWSKNFFQKSDIWGSFVQEHKRNMFFHF
jgi:hypothetical protein